MAHADLPSGIRIRYQQQYRRCGKPGCARCAAGKPGHGPYWYATWWAQGRRHARYLGKDTPLALTSDPVALAAMARVDAARRPDASPAPARVPCAPLRVQTLGGFAVWRGDMPIAAEQWRSRRALALFQCLLSVPGQRLQRDQASEWLWPEADSQAAATNLRTTIHRLRSILDDPTAGASYLRTRGPLLELMPGGAGAKPGEDWLDATAFALAARVALAGHDLPVCRDALALYAGDYLPEEPYAAWAEPPRQALSQQYLELLRHLARLSEARGELEESEQCLRQLLAAEPTDEDAAAALMGLLAASGRRAEALRVYQALATALEEELDLAPDAGLAALRARLLAQEAAPRASTLPPIAEPQVVPGGSTSLPFVGRATELALLERHIRGQGPPLLVLAGEPGIGKTRLLQTAVPRAIMHGLHVLEGGCQRRGGQAPFAPLLDALQRHIRSRPAAALRAELRGCAWLVRLLPELAGGPIEPLPAWRLSPAQERRLVVEAVTSFLTNVAGPQGVLLVLDDLQWAGADALDLLSALVRSAAPTPAPAQGTPLLRVVGAYRSTEVQPQDPLSVLLADLAHAESLAHHTLDVLDPDDAAHLFDDLLAGVEDVGPELREQVLRRTGGVPFFLVSCARGLRSGVMREDLPWNVAQSIRQRVTALPEPAREVLGAAAVVGRTVRRRLLMAVVTRSEADVLVGLEAACRARLLKEEGEHAYHFLHDVVREVIEADLGAARRTTLHRYVAEALEQQPDALPIELVAYHYARSDAPDKAVLYLERAGDLAQAQYAHAAAANYHREVIARLEGLGRACDAAGVREKLGTTLHLASRFDAALEVLEGAATIYQKVADQERLWHTLAWIGRVHAGRDTPVEGLARLQPQAEAWTGHAASPGLAALHAALAWLFLASNRYRECLAAATEAADVARASGADDALADVEVRRGMALTYLGHLGEAQRVVEGVMPLVEAVGDRSALSRIYQNLGTIYKRRGELDRSRWYRERALAISEQIGELMGQQWAIAGLGEILFLRGDWAGARAHFERAATLSRGVGWFLLAGLALVDLAELHLAMGEWQEASHYLEGGIRRTRKVELDVERLLALRDLLAGQPGAARTRLTALLASVDQEDGKVPELLTLLAWAQVALDEVAQADRTVAQAITRARAEPDRLSLVEAVRVQAMVATRQGDWDEAARTLEEGLSLACRIPYPYAEARLLHVYGTRHARKGEPEAARERLEQALTIFRRLGARKDAEWVEQDLAGLTL